MIFITHILFSIAVIATFVPLNVLNLLVLSFGSVFPDIDAASSFLGRRFPFIEAIFGHRKIVHSLFGLAFFSAAFYFGLDYFFGQFLNVFAEDKSRVLALTMYFGLGFFLHLVIDSITPSGIRFFYPFRISSIIEKFGDMFRGFDRRREHVKKYEHIFAKKEKPGFFRGLLKFRIRTASLRELFLALILIAYLLYLFFYLNRFIF